MASFSSKLESGHDAETMEDKLLKNQCRNPEKPFKEILQGKFKLSKQIKLHKCKRMVFIEGEIWVADFGTKCIKVIDVEGNTRSEISCSFTPYSVKQAPWGDILLASHNGLHILSPDGTVKATISEDVFYDVCFFGEEVVGLNSSKEILQTYSRSGDGEWRHSGDIGASEEIGTIYITDSVVTRDSEIFFTAHGVSLLHYYKCVGKTGQKMEFSSSQQGMSWPIVSGVDSTGAVLVSDYLNQSFQIHETDDQWSVVSLEPISSHWPLDLLYDTDTDTLWVLTRDESNVHYLSKIEKV